MTSSPSNPTPQVDGQPLAEVVTPGSPAEMAAVLREAEATGRVATPLGGGSQLRLGNVPARVDLGVSTAALDRIIEYEPTDLTVSVQSGMSWAVFQRELARHGQGIPLDVADPERATVGGLVATALAGPRRHGYGTLRDLLIGISVAHTSGTVTKAGGMVVKNVSGFDMMRLYHGSLGTLGVICSVNLKVLPQPQREVTVVATVQSAHDALDRARTLATSRLSPVALEIFSGHEGWQVAARLEARTPTVDRVGEEACQLLGAGLLVPHEEVAGWWDRYVREWSLDRVDRAAVIRATTRPRALGALLEAAAGACSRNSVAASFAASPRLGTLLLRLDPGITAERFAAVRTDLLEAADHVSILAAEPAFKEGIDTWGNDPQAPAVMKAIKAQFDPSGVLNPGRFAGRI